MSRYLVWAYSMAIFVSAFLMFTSQPMIGKYLLPLLGGTPAVWNTAMLFFQVLLLGGYIYAHLLTRISDPKIQASVHIALMAVACIALPLALPANNDPSSASPILWQLKTMASMAAMPFFMLSASAPLLQKWFSHTDHKDAGNPYFLYSASNAASMIALLSYPFAIEPLLDLHSQSMLWSIGYALLIAAFVLCIALTKFKFTVKKTEIEQVETLTWKKRLTWVFLAFCPSSLMLGYTTYITTDIASVPLFWVVPLALYLGTFIVAFSNKPFLTLPATRIIQAALLLCVMAVQVVNILAGSSWLPMFLHGALFFFTALMCHQELVAMKPGTSRLTEFYLFLSVGGALGGVFNSLLAPLLFKLPYEYYIVIILSLFARHISTPLASSADFKRPGGWKELVLFPGIMVLGVSAMFFEDALWRGGFVVAALISCIALINCRVAFIVTMSVILIFNPPHAWLKIKESVLISRNFFGVLRVQDYDVIGLRVLNNGTTTHGAQTIAKNHKKTPLTYYYPAGAVGDIFAELDSFKGNQKVAALGLGVGSIACYDHEGRSFDFYEINPQVVALSTGDKYFSYLQDCGSPYQIKLGDARREIEKAPDHSYDMIFVDVFSSDNIPIHIMTREALEIYRQKLKQGGMIVIHVSNRYFNLEREVAVLGKNLGMTALYKSTAGGSVPGTYIKYNPTTYTVLLENKDLIQRLRMRGWTVPAFNEETLPWTDDYANIIRALKF